MYSFQGILENEGRVYSNWGLSRTTKPAVYVEPPAEPRWQRFAREYNRLAISKLGGRASPIQTQWLEPGNIKIPKKLARPRFTTKYYEQFLV
jgi:hypothetical protein